LITTYPHWNRKKTTNSDDTIHIHWEHHPTNISKNTIRRIYNNTLKGIDNFSNMRISTSCPKNLWGILCKAELKNIENNNVSDALTQILSQTNNEMANTIQQIQNPWCVQIWNVTKHWDNKSSNTILILIKQLTPTQLFIHLYFLFHDGKWYTYTYKRIFLKIPLLQAFIETTIPGF